LSRPGTLAAALLFALATGLPAWAEGQRQVLQEDGRELEVTVSEAYSPAARVAVMDWIQSIAGALRDVYGRWPRQRWAISVSPAAASASDPIPWAQVHRGEVDRVEFFTAPQASAAELKAAWTGYHELAHLLIPYRGWGDAWFNEGLASYYQNLLPARRGLIGEREMWQRLYDGFQRAMADSDFDGQALGAVSEEMRRTGARGSLPFGSSAGKAARMDSTTARLAGSVVRGVRSFAAGTSFCSRPSITRSARRPGSLPSSRSSPASASMWSTDRSSCNRRARVPACGGNCCRTLQARHSRRDGRAPPTAERQAAGVALCMPRRRAYSRKFRITGPQGKSA